MEKTIEIPEGYEARIEGNKVVLEPKESEDERIREELVEYFINTGCNSIRGVPIENVLAYLEKQIEQKSVGCGFEIGDTITDGTSTFKIVGIQDGHYIADDGDKVCFYVAHRYYTPLQQHKEQKPVHTAKEMWKEMRLEVYAQASGNRHEPNYSDDSTKMFSLCDIDEIFEKIGNSTVGSQPADSDAIKGGDFISDGKRVFLVLANAEERNLGETGSTFCEGRILGVNGVVYCNGDDFEKFKRATSDERAKFIHDLKVRVELKEQPVEWSEEDERMLQHIVSDLREFRDCETDEELISDYEDEISWLKSARPQPKQEWSEEDIKKNRSEEYNKGFNDAAYGGKLRGWSKEDEKCCKIALLALNDHPLNQDELKAFNWLRALKSRFGWKPSEDQIQALYSLVSDEGVTYFSQLSHLKSLYQDLKKLM